MDFLHANVFVAGEVPVKALRGNQDDSSGGADQKGDAKRDKDAYVESPLGALSSQRYIQDNTFNLRAILIPIPDYYSCLWIVKSKTTTFVRFVCLKLFKFGFVAFDLLEAKRPWKRCDTLF